MLQAEDVAHYLKSHPQFFEEYADLLAQIYVPHPHGGRTISITERQIFTLRERAKQLESKLAEMIRYGEDNDAIGDKVHRLSLTLAAANDFPAVMREIYRHLSEDFAVPHIAVRLWGEPSIYEGIEFSPVADELRAEAESLARPYCGPAADAQVLACFGTADAQVRSLAVVALRREAGTMGLLALGSEDAERFYPEMGTLFLVRVGELIAAALQRTLR